ncbi:MAG TPA: hypothetical protein VFD59_05815 [Nocardioidaceae bacterium]|nr:hypothetical protein [Nocardioidaceae bacterium]
MPSTPQPDTPEPRSAEPRSAGPGPAQLDLRRPFTRAQAIAADIDPRTLRGPKFRRIFHGVYILAECTLTPQLRAEAALVIHRCRAFASHQSAARLLDVPVPDHSDEHVSVFHENDRRRRHGIACHVVAADARVGVFRGVPISMPTRLFIELAETLSLVDLGIVGDALVRKGRTTPEELTAACRDSTERHAQAALRAAEFVRSGVDSPMETRLRMLIVLAGLPEPDVNHKLYDDRGNLVRRFDLCYPDLKLLIEYDGRQHAEDPDQYDSDIYRREDLDRWEWRLVIITSKGIYQKPEETLARVRRALRERGAKGLPCQFSEEWRAHFPVRQPVRRPG